MSTDFITVVSGLPRSGTSLMMQMLQSAGMAVVSDGERTPDADNPKGYLEFEAAKKLKQDASWVPGARGKVVKVISMLLYDLPPEFEYRVIFMRRHMDEILASQKEMLKRRGTLDESTAADAAMRKHFENHLVKIGEWLAARPHFKVLEVDYNAIMAGNDDGVRAVEDFLGGAVTAAGMKGAIDAALYRNRR